MEAEQGSTQRLLDDFRADIEHDDRRALSRAKWGIGVRAFLVLFVFGYMTWISSSVARLDAPALTRLAAERVEQQLPQLRADIRDYALQVAPQLMQKAQELLIAVPAQLREGLEQKLLDETDRVIVRFEAELEAALAGAVEHQIDIVRQALPDAGPEKQLDAIILGVSGTFRETMMASIDEIYMGYADRVAELNAHLLHLQRSPDLTRAEQVDRQLIEVWMVLVHQYEITNAADVAGALQARF